MKFEKLGNTNNKKVFLYGFITCAILLIVFNFFMSYAKYKSVDSVKLASGTITYESADLNVIAMYKNDNEGKGNELIDKIPEGNYKLSNESYCIVSSNPEDKIQDVFEYKDNKVHIAIDQKNTKCYIYFEKGKTSKDTLASLGIETNKVQNSPSDFSKTACDDGTNRGGNCGTKDSGLFKGTEGKDGETYYYRGTINNNWVSFAGYWWRIIRINANGSIRLIYSGKNTPSGDGRWSNENESQIYTGVFNSNNYDNRHVGYMYGNSNVDYESTHKNEIGSTIKQSLDSWYKTNLINYTDKLDGSAGFCNDREPYNGYSTTSVVDKVNYGKSTVTTYYAPYIRLKVKHLPSFNCTQKENDLFTTSDEPGEGNGKLTYPIGLVTADEVIFAGGNDSSSNYGYWLKTGFRYWTMSPSDFAGSLSLGYMFIVNENGYIQGYSLEYVGSYGSYLYCRPVINLKADITFTPGGEGTIDNPYVVVTE